MRPAPACTSLMRLARKRIFVMRMSKELNFIISLSYVIVFYPTYYNHALIGYNYPTYPTYQFTMAIVDALRHLKQ